MSQRNWFVLLFAIAAVAPLFSMAQSTTVNLQSISTNVIELTLPQLVSESNALQIQNLLSGYEEKILMVAPDFTTSKVKVTYVPENIEAEDIMQILYQAGYTSSYKDNEGKVYEMKQTPHVQIRNQKL